MTCRTPENQDLAGVSPQQVEVPNRMKLLQFHQDHRPPFWGTWSKSSRQVSGRRPFCRDRCGLLNYDYDSEGAYTAAGGLSGEGGGVCDEGVSTGIEQD